MTDCPMSGGTHVFVIVRVETDAAGRQTTYYECRCTATQTITGPAESGAAR